MGTEMEVDGVVIVRSTSLDRITRRIAKPEILQHPDMVNVVLGPRRDMPPKPESDYAHIVPTDFSDAAGRLRTEQVLLHELGLVAQPPIGIVALNFPFTGNLPYSLFIEIERWKDHGQSMSYRVISSFALPL